MLSQSRFASVRNVDGASYLESLLVSAVAAVLSIRLYLRLTGYPRIGNGDMHIAHMLWGGLLMLVALVLLLAFLGKHVKRAAAIIGGLGFGAFIDELGKFLTSDNDYFYKPTGALIYVIFITLFMTFRWIERRRMHSRTELLVNAADMLPDVIIDGARSDEISRSLALLERAGEESEVTRAMRRVVLSAQRVSDQPPSIPTRIAQDARAVYERVLGQLWFQRAILVIFVGNAVVGIAVVAFVVTQTSDILLSPEERSFTTMGQAIAATLVWGLAIVGTIRLRHSRAAAYGWFKRSVLATIFFVQVFLFVQNQALALVGLFVNLILLSGVNALIRAEHRRVEAPPRVAT
ncbi:MAG TPA: hypothetical protein VHX16_02135 [Chloroflexota bacterium]|jgi:hypothetical protein|nr:hypothetical protein [Chloroflexota bacterium]